MHKRTKALNIPSAVKKAVWERDRHYCVLCGSPYAMPNAHYIARSQGGLGIEENIVTLCICCHSQYYNSADRRYIREEIKAYLRSMYQDWDETKLIYRKG